MAGIRLAVARVWAILRRRRLEGELDAELRHHLEMAAAAHVQRGLSPDAARLRARRELGRPDRVKEWWRDARGFTAVDDLVTDVRHGFRLLVKRPGFTLVALATLAVGIGANTAIFSLVYGVLLAPLPVPEDHRVVWLAGIADAGFPTSVSIPNYYSWEAQNQTFETIGARRNRSFILTGGDGPERLAGTQVLGDFFGVAARPAALGRTLRPEETHQGAPRLTVISHGLWQRRYAGDPGVIGEAMVLSGEAFTIIGVMPADFRFGAADVWVPMGVDDTLPWEFRASSPGMAAIARLRPGLTVEQAAADMERVGRAVQADTGWTGYMPTVTPIRDILVGDVRPAILVLFGAVGFTLLLACVNLANLLIARSDARRQEFAVRAALGAGRGRLVRQLLTESVVMALVGGLLGVALAQWAVGILVGELPLPAGMAERIGLDARVLGFTLVVSLFTGVLFGLLPALRTSHASLRATVKGESRTTEPATGHGRMRGGLVVGELALALVLLVGAGLMVQSFARLQAVDPGFRADNVVTMWTSLPNAEYRDAPAWTQFYERLLDGIRPLPGVRVSGVATSIPLSACCAESDTLPDNRPVEIESMVSATFQAVNGGYFEAMGVPLLRGRTFDERDRDTSIPVAVIDESMAEAFWPGEDPIGRRVAFEFDGDRDNPMPVWREVVGVVGHVRQYELRTPSRIQMYVPYSQPGMYFDSSRWPMAVFVRTDGDPTSIVSAVRRQLAGLDPNLPLYAVRTMDEILVDEVGTDRLLSGVLTTFALVALFLAAIGIYGVMAYTVSQRTHEIGVRMALGAPARDVVILMLRRVVALVGLGLMIGLGTAAALSRSLSNLLFDVGTGDPVTFGAIALILAAVACFASYLPARRAARVDPLVALRCE